MDKPEPLSDDTLKRAAELLRETAHELRESHAQRGVTGFVWYGEDDARELYEETLRVADGLDRYEARIAEAERSRDELVQKMHQLERERDALRADAQRYRHLRDSGDTSIYAMRFDLEGDTPVDGPDLDASIDAARAAQERPKC